MKEMTMFEKGQDTLFSAQQIEQFNADGVIGPFKLYEPDEA